MWYLWRIHDVLETGTPARGRAAGGVPRRPPSRLPRRDPGAPIPSGRARAAPYPDGEIVAGTPIPAVVPLPGKAMALMPGEVTVVPKVSQRDHRGAATPRYRRPVNAVDLRLGRSQASACSDPASRPRHAEPEGHPATRLPVLGRRRRAAPSGSACRPRRSDMVAPRPTAGTAAFPGTRCDGYAAAGCATGDTRASAPSAASRTST